MPGGLHFRARSLIRRREVKYMPPELIAALPHGAWFLALTVLYVFLVREQKARESDAARAAADRERCRAEQADTYALILDHARSSIEATKDNTTATLRVADAMGSLVVKVDSLISKRSR